MNHIKVGTKICNSDDIRYDFSNIVELEKECVPLLNVPYGLVQIKLLGKPEYTLWQKLN